MIYCAIMGLGIVGGGVADVLVNNKKAIAEKLGDQIEIKYILDIRDLHDHPLADRVINDINVILSDPDVTIVAELMGGSHPAFDFSLACLEAGKNVVTSNKEVVANFGDVLLKAAQDNGVRYLFEASVGGGIPIIRPMSVCLAANRISQINGILNGTTNYILTRMNGSDITFSEALAEAQEKGYAERDPSADIDGVDACRKIAILSALAFGKLYPTSGISVEGIRNISSQDVSAAELAGGAVKLIGRCGVFEEQPFMMVAPFVVPAEHPLYGVNDVYNAISIKGDAVGDVMFYGRGAGNLPTASAVVADMIDIAANRDSGMRHSMEKAAPEELLPIDRIPFRFCVHAKSEKDAVRSRFHTIVVENDGEIVFCTDFMTKIELDDTMRLIGGEYHAMRVLDL